VRNGGRTTALFDLSLDPRILFEAIGITLLAGLLAGIGPALLETRRLHTNPMRAMASSDRVRQRWRHALVLLEVAVTVALLVVTGGMIDTYRRQYNGDVGYSSHPLVLLRIENDKGVPVVRVRDALTRIEGVASVAPSTSMPFLPGPMRRVKTDRNGARTARVEEATITSAFFDTLGVPVRAGRAFTSQDSPASRTIILNESLAAKLFPSRDAVGQSIWIEDTRYDVVGVVAAYKNTALDSPERDPKMFLPMAQDAAAQRMSFLIRASGNPAAVERTIRREVPAMAAGNVVSSSITLDAIIDVGGQEILVGTAPLAPLIATGLLLSAAGVYGVLAFAIARRTKELALRIAIGASRRQIVALVASHSVRLVIGGTICGVAATFALSRIVRASGGGGSFLDPAWTSFVVPAAILIAIGAIATWIPSRRAIAIDPAVLFRTT
jgi:putative ABC transport system permease protein